MRPMQFDHHRPKVLLFAFLGNVLPIAVASASGWTAHRAVFFVGAGVACVVPVLVSLLPSVGRTRRIVALSGLIALTLMQAYTGGAASPFGLLMVMPMLWFGAQATDRDLVVMLVLLVGCAFVPMVVIAGPAYPRHWESATLLVMICGAVAGATRVAARETVSLTDRLRGEAILDPLTGLLNRRGWEQLAPPALARCHRSGDPVSLLAFDLDDFKALNDNYGHDHGDRALRNTAQRIGAGLRAGDVVARVGGDEFLALLVGSGSDTATATMTRLASARNIQAFSAGIATAASGEELGDLQRRADLALYAAKTAGGDCSKLAPGPITTPEAEPAPV